MFTANAAYSRVAPRAGCSPLPRWTHSRTTGQPFVWRLGAHVLLVERDAFDAWSQRQGGALRVPAPPPRATFSAARRG